MNRTSLIAFLFAFWVGVPSPGFAQEVKPFQFRSTGGEPIRLEANQDTLTVVCFIGTECPLAKLYSVRLNKIQSDYKAQGLRVIGIGSNRQDSEEELVEFAERQKLEFLIGKDHQNVIADQFNAKRTPEVFLLDGNLKTIYRGRIDDQYQPGVAKPAPVREDLRTAIEDHLAGRQVSVSKTDVEGCLIGRVKTPVQDSKITFSNQISRVLQRNCVECHRAGDIGPFSLTDYEEVVGWADMILEVIEDGRMPPWHANPNHGSFKNARRMPESDKQLMRDWVNAGAPFGSAEELPKLEKRTEGWRLPKDPDYIADMRGRPYNVPAEGTVDYQYFVVDPGFKEDKWVVAAEIIPGNRSVVHHSIVFVRPPDGVRYRGLGWLCAYVPGQRETTYPAKHGRRIPAGSKLVFQQHYTPVGTPQQDVTKLGLVFANEEEIEHEVYTAVAIDQQFEIPPHADAHEVVTDVRSLPDRGRLLGFAPHMHYRGKSCQVIVKFPNSEEMLLDVPNYDFNWQHSYSLETPIDLEDVEDITFKVKFDNSENNPVNPDPGIAVYWGDQTWEEMVVAFFEIAEPKDMPKPKQRNYEEIEFSDGEKQQREKWVTKFFSRFDKNQNGTIDKKELPHAMRREFEWLDSDSNKALTREELSTNVEWMFRNREEDSKGSK